MSSARSSGGSRSILAATTLLKSVRVHLYEDAPIRMVQLFFEVSSQSEISYKDLQKRLDVRQPVISRLAKALAEGWIDRPGLRVIERYEDPYDARNKYCRLTHRGRAVLDPILADLEFSHEEDSHCGCSGCSTRLRCGRTGFARY